MSNCIFCLNHLEENESLLVEECSVDNISALQLLKTHFDFSDVNLEIFLAFFKALTNFFLYILANTQGFHRSKVHVQQLLGSFSIIS